MKLRPLSVSLILLLGVYHASPAAPMEHGWSQHFGDATNQRARKVATDPSGNVIVVGYFEGTVDLGGGPLVSAGGDDIFVAKYDPAGNHLWSKRFGSTNHQEAEGVTTDAAGNIIVVGSFNYMVDFGGGAHVSSGSSDIFVVKLDPAGGFILSLAFGDLDIDVAYAAVVDNEGNIAVAGVFGGTVDFGGGVLTSAGLWDIFIVKFDRVGTHLWSKRFGSGSFDYGDGLATDSSGNFILAGGFAGAVDFGGGALVSAGSTDAFIAKFDAVGDHVWSHRFGNTSSDRIPGVAVDASDNVIANGFFTGPVDFGGGVLTTSGTDIFLAKFNAAGTHIWSQKFGGTGTQIGYEVTVGNAGGIAMTGYFKGDVDFAGSTFLAVGDWDAYVARFGADGTCLWSQSFGDAGAALAMGVAMDARDNVIIAGYYDGSIDFGGGPLPSAGSEDAFVAKFWAPPHIYAVRDVPGDQGGLVNLSWDACGADTPVEHGITQYTLWRSISPTAYVAMLDEGAMVFDRPRAEPSLEVGTPYIRVEQTANATYYWTLVKTVPAYYFPGYSDQIPTLFDSTSVSTENHYFQVVAHTSDPYTFYPSDPDSGYSVDNLPPAMVINLVGQQTSGSGGLAMTWAPNTEPDLDHYIVYRGTTPDFVPGPGSLLATPTEPTLDDGAWTWDSGYYYKVAAVDEHENEGDAALLGPGFVTGVEPAAIADRNYLGRNMPNPFNPSTMITFGLKKTAKVTLRIYDASGQLVRTLVDGLRPAGPNKATWHGMDDNGKSVASGVYFCRLEVGGDSLSRKLVLLK